MSDGHNERKYGGPRARTYYWPVSQKSWKTGIPENLLFIWSHNTIIIADGTGEWKAFSGDFFRTSGRGQTRTISLKAWWYAISRPSGKWFWI